MSVELVTYGSDRRLVLGNAEAIRRPIWGSSWSQIRIGLQCAFNENATNILSNPKLIFGMCSGHTNVMTAASSDHVVASRWTHSSFTAALAGAIPIFSVSSNSISGAYKRVGVTETTTNWTSTARYFSNDTVTRCGLFIEITKGSPNYTIQGACCSNPTGFADLTDDMFKNAMSVAFGDISNETPGTYSDSNTAAIAVDEGTDGVLDHIFVYWERTSHLFSFNIRHRLIA